MQSALYVALSAQVALEKRMDTVARNVANAGTAGYRADALKFETFLSHAGRGPVAYTSVGETYLARNAGQMTRTDNRLDVAVEGDAWLGIETPAGLVYTRDGRMQMTETGELQTLSGHPVLDVGGTPILLDPNNGPPLIARDGMITQGDVQVGALGLFSIPENAGLTRFGNSGVIPDQPVEPVLDFTANGVVQGFVEGANVNPMLELTKLIMVSRTFDSASATIEKTESSLQEAIRALGQTS